MFLGRCSGGYKFMQSIQYHDDCVSQVAKNCSRLCDYYIRLNFNYRLYLPTNWERELLHDPHTKFCKLVFGRDDFFDLVVVVDE